MDEGCVYIAEVTLNDQTLSFGGSGYPVQTLRRHQRGRNAPNTSEQRCLLQAMCCNPEAIISTTNPPTLTLISDGGTGFTTATNVTAGPTFTNPTTTVEYTIDVDGLDPGTVTLEYIFYEEVTTADGNQVCASIPQTMTIVINPEPVVAAPSDITVCPGQEIDPIALFATPTDNGNVFTYSSSITGIISGTVTGANPSLPTFNAPNTPDDYTVTVSVATPDGCVSQDATFTIVVSSDNGALSFSNCPVFNIMKAERSGRM
jgi:hypothetical protein